MAETDDIENLQEIVDEILTHGVTTSELMTDMIQSYEGDGVEKMIVDRAGIMLENTEDPTKMMHIAGFVSSMGNKYGSEELQNWGLQKQKEIKAKYA